MTTLLKRALRFYARGLLDKWLLASNLYFQIYSAMRGVHYAIDVGCGVGEPMVRLRKLGFRAYSVGIDLFAPYLQKCKHRKIYDDLIMASALWLPFRQKRTNKTAFLLLDIIEHIDKKDGLELLRIIGDMAYRVMILTPRGTLPQREYDENPFQAHRSGWYPRELRKLGFKVRGVHGLFFTRKELAGPRFKGTLTRLVNWINLILTPLLYFVPELTFHMLCIKDWNGKKTHQLNSESVSDSVLARKCSSN